jgi:hypothetical protein
VHYGPELDSASNRNEWLLYFFSAGQSNSSDKTKEKGSPGKVLDKPGQVGSSPKTSKRRKGKGKDSGTSSEEERWLDAIESGKLEEVRSFCVQVIALFLKARLVAMRLTFSMQ